MKYIGRSKNLQLIISIWLALSILYQVYFFEFDNGIIVGGELQRLFLKFVFTVVFMLSVSDYLSWKAFHTNLPFKLPIIYVVLSICISIPFLESAYLQALNIIFFMPIFFIDWNRDGADNLFAKIWKIIIIVTLVQLFFDPFLKFYFNIFWDNKALIGGMGNPNVFGFFLIASGLACKYLIISRLRHFSLIMFFSTALTGSLISFTVGLFFILIELKKIIQNSVIVGTFFFSLIFFLFYFISSNEYLFDEVVPFRHEVEKISGVLLFGANNDNLEPTSLTLRIEYLNDGLKLMDKSPLSLIFGHPDFLPMYNGDGLWTSFLVTYGIPLTLCFLVANLLIFYRGFTSRDHRLRFSSSIIFISICFFATNRILDYWPAAFLYVLSFTYLTNNGIKTKIYKSVNVH